VFGALHDCFSFTLDAAANSENTLLPRFCGQGSAISENGLACSWSGERVFVNPPFGKLYDWIKKAFIETHQLCDLAAVMARIAPSTDYWPMVEKADAILMFRPRLQFVSCSQDIKMSSNPQECCVVIFRRYPFGVSSRAKYLTWNWKEKRRRLK
jgi:site-specific DNA-methyltransferase (adenine-specific)